MIFNKVSLITKRGNTFVCHVLAVCSCSWLLEKKILTTVSTTCSVASPEATAPGWGDDDGARHDCVHYNLCFRHIQDRQSARTRAGIGGWRKTAGKFLGSVSQYTRVFHRGWMCLWTVHRCNMWLVTEFFIGERLNVVFFFKQTHAIFRIVANVPALLLLTMF